MSKEDKAQREIAAREAHAIEHRRLARARTLLMVAEGKVRSLADDDPQRRALQTKLHAVTADIRRAEREHEASSN